MKSPWLNALAWWIAAVAAAVLLALAAPDESSIERRSLQSLSAEPGDAAAANGLTAQRRVAVRAPRRPVRVWPSA